MSLRRDESGVAPFVLVLLVLVIAVAAIALILVVPSLQLPPGEGGSGPFFGVVSDCQSGNPISGVAVTATTSSGTLPITFTATTDSVGAYKVFIPIGFDYGATFAKSGYTTFTATFTMGSSENLNVALKPSGFGGTCTSPAVSQAFQVSDASTNGFISAASVSAVRQGSGSALAGSCTTDGTGYCKMTLSQGVTYSVTVSATGYTTQTFSLTAGTGGSYPVRLVAVGTSPPPSSCPTGTTGSPPFCSPVSAGPSLTDIFLLIATVAVVGIIVVFSVRGPLPAWARIPVMAAAVIGGAFIFWSVLT